MSSKYKKNSLLNTIAAVIVSRKGAFDGKKKKQKTLIIHIVPMLKNKMHRVQEVTQDYIIESIILQCFEKTSEEKKKLPRVRVIVLV